MTADRSWSLHDREWREAQLTAVHWETPAGRVADLIRARARGGWWDVLDRLGICLLVTREYEHLMLALVVAGGKPRVSHLRLPHPSGLAVDRRRAVVHVASTRNPNQVFRLERVAIDGDGDTGASPSLLPIASRAYPGGLYLHDLALIGGRLYGNAVGRNAVVTLADDAQAVWWPRAIERDGTPDLTRNYLQLNSIAAGSTVRNSYFTASSDAIGRRRPGQLSFPVDKRGVVFSGATREPVAGGLTRPHSARLHGADLWVDDSGYGTVGIVADGAYTPVARLPGWTRGLTFVDDVAFVGTSRVIPRFRRYAPGLEVDQSECGLHALDARTGHLLGSYVWPAGNQIFGVDWLPRETTAGFPFVGARTRGSARRLFYSFRLMSNLEASA